MLKEGSSHPIACQIKMRACRLIGTPASVIRNLAGATGDGCHSSFLLVGGGGGGHTDPTPVTPFDSLIFIFLVAGCVCVAASFLVVVGNLRALRHPSLKILCITRLLNEHGCMLNLKSLARDWLAGHYYSDQSHPECFADTPSRRTKLLNTRGNAPGPRQSNLGPGIPRRTRRYALTSLFLLLLAPVQRCAGD